MPHGSAHGSRVAKPAGVIRQMAAVKLTKTSIRLLEQPESMRSIVGAFGGEKKPVETAMLFLLSGALL